MSEVVSLHLLTYQASLGHQIASFLDSMENIRGVTQTTLKRHRTFTAEFLEFVGDIPVTGISDRHVEEFIKHCRQKGNQPRTIQSKQTSLGAMFDYLVRKKLITENPFDQVDKVRVPPSEPYVFTRGQIDMLLALPDLRTEIGLRDWAMMMFLLGTGVRIGELLQLKLTDLDFSTNQVQLRKEITKSKRGRVIPMVPMAKESLRKYLARREATGNLTDPHLFVSTRNGKGRESGQITRSAVCYRLGQYVTKSGMEWDTRVSPHTFRHTFATQWIVNGGDTESLMKILGHRNQQMLAFYVNLAIGDLQQKNKQFNPLSHVNNGRVEELRHMLNKLKKPVLLDEPGQPLPPAGLKPAFDATKIARVWDDD